MQCKCDRVLAARLLSVVLLIAQGALLDLYLIRGRSVQNFAWLTVDVVSLSVWIVLLVKPKCHQAFYSCIVRLCGACSSCCAGDGDRADGHGHQELRGMWLSWLVYSVISLGPRFGVIYYQIAPDLEVSMNVGANLVKVTLMLTAALFLCLVAAHEGPEAYTYDKFYLERVQGGVVLDILDSGEVLDVFFTEERRGVDGLEFTISPALGISIIAFALLNLALPTVALIEVEKKRKPQFKYNLGRHLWTNAKMWYIILNTLLANVPFAILRIFLWARHDRHVSVLLVKNIIYIIMNSFDLVEYCGKEGPKLCNRCQLLYPSMRLQKHQEKRCTRYRGSSTTADFGRMSESSRRSSGAGAFPMTQYSPPTNAECGV